MSVLDPIPSGRWTAERKAQLCVEIEQGRVTREAAIAALNLSAEELDRMLERHAAAGVRGLKVTKLQEIRP